MKRLFFALLLFCAIFVAKADEWTGTGFALKGKYVITNHHVVDGARTLQVRGVRGDFTKMYNAVVVATDAMHDMAILSIEDANFPGFGEIPYSIKATLSDVGEEIFVLGYPLLSTMGEEVKLTTGIISSRSGIQGEVSSYQISAPVQPGNSGGPLFDSNGDVVGIVNAKHRQADNAGYAIKSPYMSLFIQSSVGDNIIPNVRNMVNLPLVNKVKAIKPFVFILYANGVQSSSKLTPRKSQPQVREYRAGDTYKIGDIVRRNGVEGVVFEVTDGGKHGKMVSVKESSKGLMWSSDKNERKVLIGAVDETSGDSNMEKVKQITDWQIKYPAFAWCADLGEGWYLPSLKEMLAIYKNKDYINYSLGSLLIGAQLITGQYYWSSTEKSSTSSCFVDVFYGFNDTFRKNDSLYVRAVSAF